MHKLLNKISIEGLHYAILLQAALAMGGSLFFSEVMKLAPCVLCSYQRIAMYPIVVLAAMGIIRNDRKVSIYILGLAIPGLFIAIYHNLLYWHLIPESISPCQLGVSCTTKFFEWFGFVTIPFLSFLSFVVVITLALISLKKSKYEKS